MPSLGALALLLRRRWAELASFAVFMMAVLWVMGVAGLGRYTASCWPAYLPLGVALARWRWLRLRLVLGFSMGQEIFFNLFVHQYPIL